jgi:hypothetical protein
MNSSQDAKHIFLLVFDSVSYMYSSQDMRNVHPCTLSPPKLLGMPSLTLEGCDAFRGVVTGGGEAGGCGARCFLASWSLNAASKCFVSCSGSLCLVIELLLNFGTVQRPLQMSRQLLETCYRGGAGGNRWLSESLCFAVHGDVCITVLH